MSEQTELLNFVYQNARMGETALPLVIGMVSRPDLRRALSAQFVEYHAIADEAKQAIERQGRRAKEPDALKGAMAETMLHLNTLTDRSPRHVAEMMVRGSTMGTVQMSKRLHACRYTAGKEAADLAGRLLKTEENNIEQMKAFL